MRDCMWNIARGTHADATMQSECAVMHVAHTHILPRYCSVQTQFTDRD